MEAARSHHNFGVSEFLRQGADDEVDAVSDHMLENFTQLTLCLQRRWTTLTKAATEGHAEVVQEMLRSGANVNEKDCVSDICANVSVHHVFHYNRMGRRRLQRPQLRVMLKWYWNCCEQELL